MKRKKVINSVALVVPQIVKKHNLELQYERGELSVDVGEDPIDSKHKVTRLRRKSVYDEMLSRGSITKEQRDCAERYAILCEKSLGRTGDLYARMNLMRESRGNWEPSETQHESFEKLFVLWKSLGKYHTSILDMIVLGNMSTKLISTAMKLNLSYTMGQVLSTFILLEEAFEEIYASRKKLRHSCRHF